MTRMAMGCAAAIAALVAVLPAVATDLTVNPAPNVLIATPPPVVAPVVEEQVFPPPAPWVEATPRPAPPQIHYGCQRIWRCDAIVCQWRRGCWGVYGYVEGPYYTKQFAERQWESQGWPASRRHRRRHVSH